MERPPLEPAGVGLEGRGAAPSRSSRSSGSRRRPGAAGRPRPGGRPARPSPPVRAATSARRSRTRRRPVASKSTGIAPTLCAPSTTNRAPRAWASSASPATGRTAPVVHGHVGGHDEPRPGRHRGLDGRQRPARRRRRRRCRRSRSRSRAPGARTSGPTAPACSRQVVTCPVAGRHVDGARDGVHAVGRRVGQRDRRRVGREHGRHRRRAPRPGAGAASGQSSTWARPVRQLPVRELGHRRGRLGREGPDGPGVQVDAGPQRRERLRGRRPAVPGRARTGRPRSV